MVATRLNIFEAIAAGPLTAAEVAERCHTHPAATEKLLNALVSLECLRVRGERYEFRKSLREWVLADSKHSFRGQILLHFLEWKWWEHWGRRVRKEAGRSGRSAACWTLSSAFSASRVPGQRRRSRNGCARPV
jgi:Dimerisation domain